MQVSVLFSYAFRPLFLLATLYAVLLVPLWVASWLGYLPMPSMLGTPSWWHAHEMIFGFAGAAIGGFALTAVATWTKRPPVAGAPLMILSALWLLARVFFAQPFPGLLVPAIIADLGYYLLLFVLMSREVIGARNQRNYKVLGILALLGASNALFFWAMMRNSIWTMPALLAGLWLVVLLINLIGGRIIPGFTRNWLKRRMTEQSSPPLRLPPAFDRFDLLTSVLIGAFGVLHVVGASSRWTAILGLLTSVLLFVRLTRWQGVHGGGEPLVWVLHVAFAWIPLGILLLTFAELDFLPANRGNPRPDERCNHHHDPRGREPRGPGAHGPALGESSCADCGLRLGHGRGDLQSCGHSRPRRPPIARLLRTGLVPGIRMLCLALRSDPDATKAAEAGVAADGLKGHTGARRSAMREPWGWNRGTGERHATGVLAIGAQSPRFHTGTYG